VGIRSFTYSGIAVIGVSPNQVSVGKYLNTQEQAFGSSSFQKNGDDASVTFFIPLVAVVLARIFLLEYRFSVRGIKTAWSAVLVFPVFEEFAFRFLLPRLARDDDCVFRDYILFSGVFWLLHVGATSLGPFFISLYLYVVLRKTGNLAVTILFHAFWNFCFLAFSALPVV